MRFVKVQKEIVRLINSKNKITKQELPTDLITIMSLQSKQKAQLASSAARELWIIIRKKKV